jgi:hypothetical protein
VTSLFLLEEAATTQKVWLTGRYFPIYLKCTAANVFIGPPGYPYVFFLGLPAQWCPPIIYFKYHKPKALVSVQLPTQQLVSAPPLQDQHLNPNRQQKADSNPKAPT